MLLSGLSRFLPSLLEHLFYLDCCSMGEKENQSRACVFLVQGTDQKSMWTPAVPCRAWCCSAHAEGAVDVLPLPSGCSSLQSCPGDTPSTEIMMNELFAELMLGVVLGKNSSVISASWAPVSTGHCEHSACLMAPLAVPWCDVMHAGHLPH